MTGIFTASSVLTASALNTAINSLTLNAQTGTTYTFVLADAGKLVTASNASAQTYTIPLNSSVSYSVGTRIEVQNISTGAVTLSPAGGVTLNGATTVAPGSRVQLTKTATDTWYSVNVGYPESATATVATSQTTTSATFTDLATVGPAVTVTTGTKALVILTASGFHSVNGNDIYMGFAVSGATTLAASDALAWYINAGNEVPRFSAVYLVTGLTAGSNTFTAKYRTSAATATLANRSLVVINMGS